MNLQSLAENAIETEGPFFYDDLTLGSLEILYKRGFKEAYELVDKKLSAGIPLQEVLWELKSLIDQT